MNEKSFIILRFRADQQDEDVESKTSQRVFRNKSPEPEICRIRFGIEISWNVFFTSKPLECQLGERLGST